MSHDVKLRPVVKWAGGKRSLLKEILPLIPEDADPYVEPFLGGGAVLLATSPGHAIVNDANPELMNAYRIIRDSPDELIRLLQEHRRLDSKDHFLEVRGMDRHNGFGSLEPVVRAARFLYLNKTCYNGLYRVNSRGQFNAPYGWYGNPKIVDEDGIRSLSDYLRNARIELQCGDYSDCLRFLAPGAFVYLDPPYLSPRSAPSFTGYTRGGVLHESAGQAT